jgi:hypothetical protein
MIDKSWLPSYAKASEGCRSIIILSIERQKNRFRGYVGTN